MKLRLDYESGRLVERARVERDYARTFGVVAKLIDVIPDLIEPDGCGPDIVDRVEHRLEAERAAHAKRMDSIDRGSATRLGQP